MPEYLKVNDESKLELDSDLVRTDLANSILKDYENKWIEATEKADDEFNEHLLEIQSLVNDIDEENFDLETIAKLNEKISLYIKAISDNKLRTINLLWEWTLTKKLAKDLYDKNNSIDKYWEENK